MQACKGGCLHVQNRTKSAEVEYGFVPTLGQGNDLHAGHEKKARSLSPESGPSYTGEPAGSSLLLQRFNRGQIVIPKEHLVEPQAVTAARMRPRQ